MDRYFISSLLNCRISPPLRVHSRELAGFCIWQISHDMCVQYNNDRFLGVDFGTLVYIIFIF
jgi:hypothetical protein